MIIEDNFGISKFWFVVILNETQIIIAILNIPTSELELSTILENIKSTDDFYCDGTKTQVQL